MADSNFVDYVKIFCRSGHGGPGSRHFRREKFAPKGGPDGGDGGRGGHVILRGNAQMWTLLHLKYRKHIYAEHGESGGASRSTGADGADIILDVPLGTVARDAETGENLFEITQDGETAILVKADVADWEITTSKQQQIRPHTMRSQVKTMLKAGKSLN